MKPLSQHLTDLIAIVDDLNRNGWLTQQEGFVKVRAELRHLHETPCEGIRRTYSAAVVIDVIEGLQAAEGEKKRAWMVLLGAALPMLRDDAYQAYTSEFAARGGRR